MDEILEDFFIDYFCGFNKGMTEPHLHVNSFEISLCIKGQSRVLLNERLEDINSAYLLFFSPNTLHKIIPERDKIYERYNITFRRSFIYKALPEICKSLEALNIDGLIIPLTSKEVEKILNYIYQMQEYEEDGKVLLLALILINIGNLSRTYKRSGKRNSTYISDVLIHIEKNINKKLYAVEIAQHFYISRAKLDADFKKETGLPLNEYIILLRLKNAKILLHNGCSVIDTSRKSGFNDLNHFIRCFKRHVGVTPLKYAKGYSREHPELK